MRISQALRTPAFIQIDPVAVNGKPDRRLMVVLRTNGCTFDYGGAGCTMCDFAQHAIARTDALVQSDHYLSQIEVALQSREYRTCGQVDLLTLGSFFNPKEISLASRLVLLSRLSSENTVRKIVTEGRACYLTKEAIKDAMSAIRADQHLEVGLGIETSNIELRNGVLRKQLHNSEIQRVMENVAQAGTSFLAYLLIKPPSLSEYEAVDDAVRSAEWVVSVARRIGVDVRVAFEPVFATAKLLRHFPRYACCSLWTVVNVIKKTHGLAPIFVGLSDEGLADGYIPRSCPNCDHRLRYAIQRYNAEQNVDILNALACDCTSQSKGVLVNGTHSKSSGDRVEFVGAGAS